MLNEVKHELLFYRWYHYFICLTNNVCCTTMKKTNKKDTPTITNVLVQAVNDMSSKLHRVHKDVANNSKDINELKQQVSFSKGAVKVLLWLAGALTTIMAIFQWIGTR